MQLVENYERDDYEYIPPVPGEWRGGASDIEIERDWVTDSRPKVCRYKNVPSMVIRYTCSLYIDDQSFKFISDPFANKKSRTTKRCEIKL